MISSVESRKFYMKQMSIFTEREKFAAEQEKRALLSSKFNYKGSSILALFTD